MVTGRVLEVGVGLLKGCKRVAGSGRAWLVEGYGGAEGRVVKGVLEGLSLIHI